MSQNRPDPARALRRRRKHERQAVVFGSLIAALALAGLGATAVYTGALELSFLERDFTTPPPDPEDVVAAPPCLPGETFPVDPTTTQIRVLNGTSRSGLAGRTQTDLQARGFAVVEVGNFRPVGVTGTARIYFGEQGIATAYTLKSHIPSAQLILDLRQDASVDVVLGLEWENLVPLEEVGLDGAVPLADPPGCIPMAEALTTAAPAPTPSAQPTDAPAGEQPATEEQPLEEGELPAEGDIVPEG
jgi:hypothetical protein